LLRNKHIKTILQQLNFYLGRNPVFIPTGDWRKFIPERYKAIVIISADFELAWAWRYTKSSPDPLQKALGKARLERENMPKILALCDHYNIPITWLTVGHLFLESCSKLNGVPHPEIPRLSRFENDWWRFSGNDWFEHDPCTNSREDPLWYAPDLIKKILNSKVKHEIGCHTFSHIDCRDSVCTPELFKAELEACNQAANRVGIDKMESFVHPGHTIGNLETLAKTGFTSYRTDHANILGYPYRHENGLWEFTTTLEFDYFPDWPVNAQVNRYITLFKRAIRHNAVAYLWFHPSIDPVFAEQIMPSVFDWLDRHRDIIRVVTTGEYVQWLNNKK
jgi:peptidoglycan/xylan/chitin deacetylase (PgdA/CDA1 family)